MAQTLHTCPFGCSIKEKLTMTINANHNNGTLQQIVCAIVFLLFTIIYLYFFQADLLAMEQHVLSGGTTHYERNIGTLVITSVLMLLQMMVSRLLSWRGKLYALTYLPSAALLGLLTSIDEQFSVHLSYGGWLWLTLLLIVLYIVLTLRYHRDAAVRRWCRGKGIWEETRSNLFIMLVLLLGICGMGNTDAVLHYRLHMEHLISEGQYEKALSIGEKSDETDVNLTMLRACALTRTRNLGNALFEYAICGGSESLLPNGNQVKCLLNSDNEMFKLMAIRPRGNMSVMKYLMYLDTNGLGRKSVTDYLLCGYLLDGKIDAFARSIVRKYNIESPTLPKHYKEALTLYTHLRSNPVVVFHTPVMDADYADFVKTVRTYKDKHIGLAYTRSSYGNTYWQYYFEQLGKTR